ncbi:MAG: PUA domain-containing protein [Candidatus Thermoplasmatota archaeon]|nr:PUA domain-containing protein [Candidatus Thermoplasmatota archaeon]
MNWVKRGKGIKGIQCSEANMSKEWVIKKRRPVRKKIVLPLLKELSNSLGVEIDIQNALFEFADYGTWNLILINKLPMAIELKNPNGEIVAFPTLKGILNWKPVLRWVAVDRGAIPFLLNGADCMMAGVQDCDPDIVEQDLVWICDEVHKKPIAVGWALTDGPNMIDSKSNKGISTIHWIGDELWNLEL